MKSEHSLSEMAEALDVSSSGFESHRGKGDLPRQQQDKALKKVIEPIFEQSRRTYGSPRLVHALRGKGWRCGKNRIARLLRSMGLRVRQKRRFRPSTTDSSHRWPVAQNWMGRIPNADRPDQIWAADITYIPTQEGWLYLAGVMDMYSRKIVGWNTSETLSTPLVTRAWDKAWKDRRPSPGLLHHSDRGIQYASGAFQALLGSCGAAASMSRKGNCYDNAAMESFWATLKTECFESSVPTTRAQARLMIFDYIEAFYNRSRLHSSLGYQSPMDFENQTKYTNN